MWHPVAYINDVTDSPIAVRLLDEPLVIVRLNGEIACFGLTEPGSGSDSAAMATTAKPDPSGNGWILNGSKRYITTPPTPMSR